MRGALFLVVAAAVLNSAVAQDQPSPKFDVVSIRPAGAEEDASNSVMRGGPGTSDPGKITWRQPLSRLLVTAYGLDYDQITGPGWLASEYYTIVANVPPGTTKDQVRLMWKDVLLERFHLQAHFIKKDFPAYELSVAKNGPKLRNVTDGPARPEPGFPEPKPGVNMAVLPKLRDVRLTFRDCTMAEFSQRIGWPLSALGDLGGLALGRVIDKTGLDGHYNFTLEFAGQWGPGGANPRPLPDGETDAGSSLFDAIRQQLGLELKEKKAPLDVLVVDRVDKVPTEN